MSFAGPPAVEPGKIGARPLAPCTEIHLPDGLYMPIVVKVDARGQLVRVVVVWANQRTDDDGKLLLSGTGIFRSRS